MSQHPRSRKGKPRDMTGTAYCSLCKVGAVHERGPGTPLVIPHKEDCPEHPRNFEEQCVCGTGFTCMATEHDKGLVCPDCGEYPCHPDCLSGGGL